MKREGTHISFLSKYLVVMMVLILLGCSKNKDQSNPITSATSDTFTISPTNSQVIKGGVLQFLPQNAVGGIHWSVNDTSLATFTPATSVLVVGAKTGTVTVTATDSSGRKASTSVTITENKIILTPSTLTLSQLGTQTATFTTVGATATVTFNLTGETNGYQGASISSSGVLTVSTWPTPGQGTQSLTITASDGVATAGTATVTLPAPTSISVAPANITLGVLASPTSITYSTVPISSTVIFNLTGETNGYTGAKIAGSSGVLALTTSPTAAQGTQTLTITATDGSLTASTTITLTAD